MNIKKPLYADISLTPFCNLKCGFCYAGCNKVSSSTDFLTLEDYKKLFNEFDELEILRVGFEGGEPFLRNDIIPILEEADKHYFNYFINTNGTLITEKIAESLSKLTIDKLCISIDGPNSLIHDKSRGIEGSFEKMLNGVTNAQKYNIPIDGIITLSNINKDYIVEILEFMKQINIKQATIMLLATVGSASEDMKKYYLDFSEWEKLFLKLTDMKKNNSLPIPLSIVPPSEAKIPMEFLLPLYRNNRLEDLKYWKNPSIIDLENDVFGCTAGKDNFSIDGYGNVFGCSMMISNLDLKSGNVKNNSLVNIWYNSEKFLEFRNLKLDEIQGYCKDCKLISYCQGGCRACAFSFKNNLKDSDFRCPLTNGGVII